ncbi:MAG TPA: DHA2 family efflux MFS transporter permease subunit [Acidimicrobiia bacterium]|nr:DHA2 family efflux MFS transporter permease subunit [Acidimicrobiia bacterium]
MAATATATTPAPATVQPHPRRWSVLGVLCLSLLVVGLDNTILNVALPSLVRDLHASNTQLQWIVDAYTIVFASALLVAGSLGDRFGRRGCLLIGLLIFGAGSAASAFAGSANQLIFTRGVMGIGGALIMPATLSILTNVFPAEELGRAIGIWAGVSGLGVAIGPMVGGWLLDNFWWGSVFLVNVPIIVLALIAVVVLVPTSRDPSAPPLDALGFVLSAAGITALLFGIIEAPTHGWSSTPILVAFTIGVVLVAAFVLWEMHTEYPMLDVRFFQNPRFSAASVAVTLVFFAMFGSLFFLSQYLQFVLGYDPLQAGIRTLPVAVALMVAAPTSSVLVRRFGSKLVVAGGLAVVAVALALLTRATATSGYPLVAVVLLVLGLGMGTAMAPATESIMGSLPPERAGVGSAVNDTTRQLGGALGVAVLGSVMQSAYVARVDAVPQLHELPPAALSAVRSSVGGAAEVAAHLPAQFREQLVKLANEAFVHGMTRAVIVGAVIALCGALVALVFLPARPVAAAEAPAELDELVVATAQAIPTESPRRRVLSATVDLLKEAGFSSLNFHAVSTKAGVSTSTLERIWSSKVDLVTAVVAELSERLPVPDTGSVRDDAIAYLDALASLFAAPWAPGVIAVLVGEAGRHPDLAARLRTSVIGPHRAALIDALRRGVARGELAPDTDVGLVGDVLVGPLYYRLLVTGEPVDTARADALVDHAFRASAVAAAPRPD